MKEMMNRKIPLRQCVGCREMSEKMNMIRVVKTPEGYRIDETGKMNGRGAYLCKKQECLLAAIKNHGLEKSFHESISGDVYDALRMEFKQIEG